MMRKTTRHGLLRKLTGGLLVAALLAGALPVYAAQGETTLRIELKGVFSTQLGVWRSIDLSARFQVLADGAAEPMATLLANPTAEQREIGQTDQMTLPDGVTSVSLLPMAEDFDNGFACKGPITLSVQPGRENVAPVFAYASQGYFALRTLRADTEADAGQAEYAVLDDEGNALLSFDTDENGGYAAQTPLPAGRYQLAQMRAPEGTLPLEGTVPLEIATYFGQPEDIADVRVVNQAIPLQNAQVSALRWQTQAQVESFSDRSATLRGVLAGLCDGANTAPLRGFAATLLPPVLLDEFGSALGAADNGWVASVRVDEVAEGVAVRVQPCDANGTPLAQSVAALPGETMALDGYQAALLKVTYESAADPTDALPVGFEAGTLTVEWAMQPYSAEQPVETVRLEAQVHYAYEYPGADGASVVSAESEVPSCVAAVPVSDGRARLQLQANVVSDENGSLLTLALDEANSVGLPTETQLLCVLPEGVRVDAGRMDGSFARLYQSERDAVGFSLSQLRAGAISVPTVGQGEGVMMYALDPCGLAANARNPEGASLFAEAYERNLLFDALLGEANGLYARLDCALTGAFSGGDAQGSQLLLQGEAAWEDGQPAEGLAVAVRVENDVYGALTDADGRYAINAPQSATVAQGALCYGLPAHAVCDTAPGTQLTLGNGATCSLRVARRAAIVGQVTLDERQALPGVLLTLHQGGVAMATAVSDEAGRFAFDHLVNGAYQLRAELPDGSNAQFAAAEGVSLTDGLHAELDEMMLSGGAEARCTLHAVSLVTVEGTASAEGAGVAGLAVTLTDAQDIAYSCQTDAEGRFALAGVPAGAYTLTVQTNGLTLARVNGEAAQGAAFGVAVSAAGANAYQLELQPAAAIVGAVAAQQAGQSVTVASAAGQTSVPTGVDGSFAVEGLSAGEYTLYVALPEGLAVSADSGWQPTQQGDELWRTVALQAGERLTLPAITLSPVMELRGTAYYDANLNGAQETGESPVADVQITVQAQVADGAWQTLASRTTGADGAYCFGGLGAGAYRIVAASGAGDWAVASVGGAAEAAQGLPGVASGTIRLDDGQAGLCDVTLAQPSGLHLAAFADENGNGVRGEYEGGLPGVLVEVIDASGNALATGTTDGQGDLTLPGLPTGDYALRVTLPRGCMFTTKGGKLSLLHSAVGDTQETMAVSDALSFRAGATVEAGVAAVSVGSLSGRVWNDVNGDGLIGDDEPGVADIEIHLRGLKTGDRYELTTDETGLYRFVGLRNDTYTITCTPPDGMLFTRYTQTGGDLRSIYTGDLSRTGERQFVVSGAQDVTDKHIGLIYEGSISGLAFLDTNYNGFFDDGEPAYRNVRVELIKVNSGDSLGRVTTDDTGAFAFTGLRGGVYRVRVILPEDGSIFTRIPDDTASDRANLLAQRPGRRENSLDGYTLQNGQAGRVMVGVAMPASVMGTVFLDADYSGHMGGKEKKVSGMTVRLLDEQGGVVAETATVGNGRYKLEGVMPGAYTVAFLRQADDEAFTRLPDEAGDDGNAVVTLDGDWGLTGPVNVAMGVDVKNVNAGVLPSATITGVFFNDLNDNGLRDEGEGGAVGATVELLDEAGQALYARDVGEDGAYFFDGVLPGRYTLRYRLLPHTEAAREASGGNTLTGEGLLPQGQPFDVAVGEAVEAPLRGAVTLGSFEGVAFHDVNANGVQDAGEESMADVVIELTNGKDDPATARTQTDGAFALSGLRPGQYRLSVTLPEGYIFSADLEQAALSLGMGESVSQPVGWEALTNRAAYALGGVRPASVAATLWLDENMDGSRADGEAAMEGLSVELIDERAQAVMATATTGADGLAAFPAVRPGSYTLRFKLPQQAQPATSDNTFAQSGDAMLQTGLTLAEDERYAGAVCGLISRTTIAGCVRLDEAGVLTPMEGLDVRLYQDGATAPAQTTRTDANGNYRFDGLWPARYVVEVQQPAGTLFVSRQDTRYTPEDSAVAVSDGQFGRTDEIALRMAKHLANLDAVLVKPAVVGELAWLDENQNGLIDLGEPGLPGVTVELIQNGQTVDTATTDAYGYYVFDDVYPGEYRLRAKAYPEVTITQPVPGMQMISSCLTDGDGAQATSDAFTVESGERYVSFHLGYALLGEKRPDALVAPPSQDWTHGYDYVTK